MTFSFPLPSPFFILVEIKIIKKLVSDSDAPRSVLRLRFRVVSQGMVCVHSVDGGSCLLIRVCFFTDSRGSTLYIFSYVSFAYVTHRVRVIPFTVISKSDNR